MNAFITGSHAYGKPTPKSDIDLVVRVDGDTKGKLHRLAKIPLDKPLRFGNLNLILCTDDIEMAVWKTGTAQMSYEKHVKDVTSDSARGKEVLDSLRNLVGLNDLNQSGKG